METRAAVLLLTSFIVAMADTTHLARGLLRRPLHVRWEAVRRNMVSAGQNSPRRSTRVFEDIVFVKDSDEFVV
jgi:hypothetical protein